MRRNSMPRVVVWQIATQDQLLTIKRESGRNTLFSASSEMLSALDAVNHFHALDSSFQTRELPMTTVQRKLNIPAVRESWPMFIERERKAFELGQRMAEKHFSAWDNPFTHLHPRLARTWQKGFDTANALNLGALMMSPPK
jgi:hypothetical protein